MAAFFAAMPCDWSPTCLHRLRRSPAWHRQGLDHRHPLPQVESLMARGKSSRTLAGKVAALDEPTCIAAAAAVVSSPGCSEALRSFGEAGQANPGNVGPPAHSRVSGDRGVQFHPHRENQTYDRHCRGFWEYDAFSQGLLILLRYRSHDSPRPGLPTSAAPQLGACMKTAAHRGEGILPSCHAAVPAAVSEIRQGRMLWRHAGETPAPPYGQPPPTVNPWWSMVDL